MTGIDGFCACTEVVQAAAAAISERTSRRPINLRDAVVLTLARFIPFTNRLSVGRRSQHIARR